MTYLWYECDPFWITCRSHCVECCQICKWGWCLFFTSWMVHCTQIGCRIWTSNDNVCNWPVFMEHATYVGGGRCIIAYRNLKWQNLPKNSTKYVFLNLFSPFMCKILYMKMNMTFQTTVQKIYKLSSNQAAIPASPLYNFKQDLSDMLVNDIYKQRAVCP